MTQSGVLLELLTADLDQDRLLDAAGGHRLQQLLGRRFARARCIPTHLARKLVGDACEDVDVRVDHRHYAACIVSRQNNLRRAGVVSRSAIDAYRSGDTLPSLHFS